MGMSRRGQAVRWCMYRVRAIAATGCCGVAAIARAIKKRRTSLANWVRQFSLPWMLRTDFKTSHKNCKKRSSEKNKATVLSQRPFLEANLNASRLNGARAIAAIGLSFLVATLKFLFKLCQKLIKFSKNLQCLCWLQLAICKVWFQNLPVTILSEEFLLEEFLSEEFLCRRFLVANDESSLEISLWICDVFFMGKSIFRITDSVPGTSSGASCQEIACHLQLTDGIGRKILAHFKVLPWKEIGRFSSRFFREIF